MTILRTMRNFSSMNITASILLFLAAISAGSHYCELFCGSGISGIFVA
jgi:hypothetical protein